MNLLQAQKHYNAMQFYFIQGDNMRDALLQNQEILCPKEVTRITKEIQKTFDKAWKHHERISQFDQSAKDLMHNDFVHTFKR